jgi:hypothetical protein
VVLDFRLDRDQASLDEVKMRYRHMGVVKDAARLELDRL